MARADLLNILYSKNKSPLEFQFDSLWLPSMNNFLNLNAIESLYNIASSVKYSSKTELKYKLADEIMNKYGFVHFAGGTNRRVYRHLENTSFVAKVAIDKVALSDSPAELKNQFILKPFVTKVFEVSQCGTIGFFERVEGINHEKEFEYAAEDIFYVLYNHILSNYVLEDIGSKYFQNWGIRKGFGPCLLDFPYVYELDGSKLFCGLPKYENTKFPLCEGEIDYDAGFNELVCTRCGHRHHAKDLAKKIKNSTFIVKGECDNMRIMIVKGDKVICDTGEESEIIKPRPVKKQEVFEEQEVSIAGLKNRKNKSQERIVDNLNNTIQQHSINTLDLTSKVISEDIKPCVEEKVTRIELKQEEKTDKESIKFILSIFLENCMDSYPYNEDEVADLKQRKKIENYLLEKLNEYIIKKNIKINTEISIIINDFIDKNYNFENEVVEEPTEAIPEVESPDDKLLSQYSLKSEDFNEKYEDDENSPKFEKIRSPKKNDNMEKY